MKPNTTDEIIAVVEAFKRGEEIEGTFVGIEPAFYDEPNPSWDFPCKHYRVKAKEKRLVPHWPAVRRGNFGYFITDTIFSDADYVPKHPDNDFIRLATEYPPIMLEVEE